MDAYRLGISDAGAVASKAFVVTASLHANTCGFAEDTCSFRRAAGTLGQINNQFSYFTVLEFAMHKLSKSMIQYRNPT